MFTLESLGWNEAFLPDNNLASDPSLFIARVVEEQRDLYQLASACGECAASLAGRLRNDPGELGFPAVGDWVVARRQPRDDRAVIVRVLPRRSCFSRKAPQTGLEQIVAANIDVALVVAAIGGDFNLRRVERYVAVVWESGARPIVVLTKCDLSPDVDDRAGDIAGIAPGVRVLTTSAVDKVGLDALRAAIAPGQTAVIVGSSGTGKSTLINCLLRSQAQLVSDVSAHADKGRHTTTARKLFRLPGGGMIIDTPGMREMQFYDVDEGLAATFEDVERLVGRCRFSDCEHRTEPDCAIRAALDDGSLDPDRWSSYRKLQREAAHQIREVDAHARRKERDRWKKIAIHNRKHPKNRF